MSKFLVLCTQHHYPSVYVFNSKEHADTAYKALTEGYKDWGDYFVSGVDDGDVEIIEVENTTLKTICWAGLTNMHPELYGVFL